MIDAIFLQACLKEILNGRFFKFLNKLDLVFDFSVPLVIFLPLSLKVLVLNNPPLAHRSIDFVFFKEPIMNPESLFFYDLINWSPEKFKRVLLLETDCIVKSGFLSQINAEISKLDDFLMFGSKYYGIAFRNQVVNNYLQNHINGVAVYNRSPENLKIIDDAFIHQGLFETRFNYDVAICKELIDKKINFKNKLIDSKSILNVCRLEDIDLDYSEIKPSAKIIHTKSIF